MKRLFSLLKRSKYIFISFVTPVIIIAGVFVFMKIYPFGDNTIAVHDMYHQYVPVMSEIQHKLQTGGSFFYSFNGGGGVNFIPLLANHGSDPLTLIFLLIFPKKLILECSTLLIILKIGIAGSTMYVFLDKSIKKRRSNNFITVVFSLCYALSGYVTGYYWNLMWLNGVMLLPLCCLGVEYIINKKKPMLFIISYGILIFSNYYIAAMSGIFLVLYFFILCLESETPKKNLKKTPLFFVCFVTAIAITGILTVPTFFSIKDTGGFLNMENGANYTYFNSPILMLSRLLPGASPTIFSGPPNIYCGLIIALLCVCFLFCKTIPLWSRVINTAFIAFLFISMEIPALDYMWNLLHSTNFIPYRHAFVLCFAMIRVAWITYNNISINIPKFIVGMVCAATFVEIGVASFSSVSKTGVSDRNSYLKYDDVVSHLYMTADADPHFVRTELLGNPSENQTFLYNYRGISIFDSSISGEVCLFMRKLGLISGKLGNRYQYRQLDTVDNVILNIGYIMSERQKLNDNDFIVIGSDSGLNLFKNTLPLSFGYVLPESILSWDISYNSAKKIKDDYIRAATDGKYTDRNDIQKAFPEMSKSSFYVREYNDTHLNGYVDSHGSGIFMSSLLFDKGWKVRMDGNEVSDLKKAGVFLCFPIEAGHHEIEFEFHPAGLGLGIICTVCGVSSFVVLIVLMKRIKSSKKALSP